MKISDSLRRDREVLRKMAPRERVQFLWDYYKIPILAAVICVTLAALVLGNNIGRRQVALYAVFVNTDVTDAEPDRAALDQVLADAGVDMTGKGVDVTANLYLGTDLNSPHDGQTLQVLAALFGISDLDLFAADEAAFKRYADQNAFADLSVLIEPELLEKHAADLYAYPAEDGQTVVGGIVLHPGSVLHTAGYYHGDIVVGAAIRAENLEEAVLFIRQLL